MKLVRGAPTAQQRPHSVDWGAGQPALLSCCMPWPQLKLPPPPAVCLRAEQCTCSQAAEGTVAAAAAAEEAMAAEVEATVRLPQWRCQAHATSNKARCALLSRHVCLPCLLPQALSQLPACWGAAGSTGCGSAGSRPSEAEPQAALALGSPHTGAARSGRVCAAQGGSDAGRQLSHLNSCPTRPHKTGRS